MNFERHRRLRSSQAMRDLVRENTITMNDFIYPIFIKEEGDTVTEVSSMPGVYQFPLSALKKELDSIVACGIQAVILFGIPSEKDAIGTGAFHTHGIIQEATRLIKKEYPDLLVVADTCLCEFTDHGHCGIVEEERILNDESLEILVKTAISQAEAGADIIAPSNMMDGFVQAIRDGLDQANFKEIPIMSYAVKYASAFYGPFREAADGAPQFGDRKTYQMDPANRKEAFLEAKSDEGEGADFIIVKPAMSYLDIVRDIRNTTNLPVVAYNVSGEYAMVKAASQNNWIDEEKIVMEMLLSMKRAGADIIISYFAKDVANYLNKN
ncbi:porphobilinogen synthase [Listeria fleischmannii]|uniref:Delta-aminolevulinic acid dehydratase n=2 Tax=Listeria fleischmannii TaxID=1069827 RepID=A0A2X3HEF5_9LIST|nr:porphobilinogen synthase [Listeria fleischmannii]EMG27903.1 delta-aminolevulinic acid dehydratase [Listeria fleischmannii subsp. fleischmannii LU2006-1]SQC69654.1 Delta-aminolevulinic acid dehydratase [Listeria fleischmannii subsp. fleischmannii]